MHCSYCNRDMTVCTCDDADERLASLQGSKYLDQRWISQVIAHRRLNKDVIEAARKEAKEKGETPDERESPNARDR